MEILILLVFIVLNGVFSTSEAAVIAARKARLQQLAEKGDKGAQTALVLAQEPIRFLSTIQVGITLIGIITGAVGGASIAAQIADLVRPTPLGQYADAIGFGVVIVVTTYLSLIIGELVPKRLALRFPEQISAMVARPMNLLTRMTSPLITFLTLSTDFVVFLLGVRASEEPPVTEEEIKTMMQQGIEAGVFEEVEQDMVSGIFRLGDRRAVSLMTPRTTAYWLNMRASEDEIRTKIKESIFSYMPVCDGDTDHVVGLLSAKKFLSRMLAGDSFDVEAAMDAPQFVPESMPAAKVLELFRKSGQHCAIVIGEYGGMEGMITMQDLLEEIVGDVEESAPQSNQREDGSWLIDGLMPIDDFKKMFSLEEMPGEHDHYTTLGGFVMTQLGKIPTASDQFDWTKLHFEVMDMDGNRVDKMLVSEKIAEPVPEPAPAEVTKEVAKAETEEVDKAETMEVAKTMEAVEAVKAETAAAADAPKAETPKVETPKAETTAAAETAKTEIPGET